MSNHGHVVKIFIMGADFDGFQLIEMANLPSISRAAKNLVTLGD